MVDKDGSLKTVNEYEQISPRRSSYRLGNLPFYLKNPKFRAISCCAENVCTRKTYVLWRNMLYEAGYSETSIGESRMLLVTRELETVGRYFWDLVFEASSQDKISAGNAMEMCLNYPRLTIEMLPKSASCGQPGEGPSS